MPDTDTKLKGKLTVAHNITSETIFAEQDKVAPLSIIALESARELGEKINAHLTEWAHKSGRTEDTFMVEAECPRLLLRRRQGNYQIQYPRRRLVHSGRCWELQLHLQNVR